MSAPTHVFFTWFHLPLDAVWWGEGCLVASLCTCSHFWRYAPLHFAERLGSQWDIALASDTGKKRGRIRDRRQWLVDKHAPFFIYLVIYLLICLLVCFAAFEFTSWPTSPSTCRSLLLFVGIVCSFFSHLLLYLFILVTSCCHSVVDVEPFYPC